MRLSVLDQSPISEGSTGADALRNTIDLARLADELGYHRYWVAEHHGGPMLAGAKPRGADRPDRVGHRGDPGRQRRRDAPALQPVQGRRDVHDPRRAVPGPDRPRPRPRRRHRSDDHVRAPARPPPGRARRLPPAARRAARVPRRQPPRGPSVRAARRRPARAPGAAGAVAARLLAAERDLGGRAGPSLCVRRLHQLRGGRHRQALPRALRARPRPPSAADGGGGLGAVRADRRGGRVPGHEQPDELHAAAPGTG